MPAQQVDKAHRSEAARGNLDALAALIRKEHHALLARWRQQVRKLPSARQLDTLTLDDHLPGLLEELAAALQSKSDQTITEALSEGSSPAHGLQRAQDAFDIEEVVAEYNVLRGCVHDLADDNGLTLQGKPFHIINRVFDQAIGLAVRTYAAQRALEVQRRREEYLAFVAHDLRTPLNAISLAGKVLETTFSAEGASAQSTRMLNALHRSVQHLESLIGKILEENANLPEDTGIKLERREFDLWPLVEGLLHELHPMGQTRNTELINQVPEDLVIYADAGLLRRIFQNLIANAIRYTPSGEIGIGAKDLGAEGAIECWVSDSGAGISSELIEKVFDKGETNPEQEGGTGLGLAIVKTFTEAHGGEVSVDSEEGIGTTFRFSLPLKVNKPVENASQ